MLASITSGVAVADLNGDNIAEVIFGTGDGRVYAYSINGKVLDGFPHNNRRKDPINSGYY
jgi:hypothetical protein